MISAIVLSHNDEKTLASALRSVAWCDETIVIDDYSTDRTILIVQELGVKLFQRHLKDNFAAQRNFGLSKAKGEWVLFVDSDEVVSDSLQSEIQKILRSKSVIVGYYIMRKDTIFGRHIQYGETSKVRLLRLAKKDAGAWRRPVHEVWNVHGQTGELREPILHSPHPNVAQFIDAINRYSTLNAKYLYEQRIRVHWWDMIIYPKTKFFMNYVWHQGYRDGTAGAIIALTMSFHSFLTRAKLWQLYQKT